MGQYRENTVQRFRRSGVNPDHSSPGDRGLDRIKISGLWHGLLIRVRGRSSDFGDPVQPSKADTDRLTTKAGAHDFCSWPATSPSIAPAWRRVRSASSDATVLRTMVILNALSWSISAWASSTSAASRKFSTLAAAPRRKFSAAVARQGLWATPPNAIRTSRMVGLPAASLRSLRSRAAATEMRAKAYEARSRTLR